MDGLNSIEDLEKLLFANDIANMLEDQQQKGSVKELANGVSGIFANKTFTNKVSFIKFITISYQMSFLMTFKAFSLIISNLSIS